MIETRRLKNVIFIETILSFALSKKIINCLCMKIILGSLFSIIDSLSHKKVKVMGRGGKTKN